MEPFKGGAILGDGLFGGPTPGEYEKQIRRVGEAESAVQQARRDRSLALIDAARQDARGKINPALLQRVMAGDLAAQAELGSSVLGSNQTIDMGQLGKYAQPHYGEAANIQFQSLLGDTPDAAKANRAAAYISGDAYQPIREEGGAYIADGATLGDLDSMVPTLGTASSVATDRAQAANSYASAARTRQAMGIDAGQYALQRAGQWNPGGDDNTLGGSGAGAGKVTEGERSSAGYLQRMTAAEKELQALVDAGYDSRNLRDYYTAGEGPFRNSLASPQGQQNRQQQEDWVRAKLRKESGAVIGEEEMDREIKTYFPQPGDQTDVINSKARSRQRAIEQMRINAGRVVPTLGDSQPAPAAQGQWKIRRRTP